MRIPDLLPSQGVPESGPLAITPIELGLVRGRDSHPYLPWHGALLELHALSPVGDIHPCGLSWGRGPLDDLQPTLQVGRQLTRSLRTPHHHSDGMPPVEWLARIRGRDGIRTRNLRNSPTTSRAPRWPSRMSTVFELPAHALCSVGTVPGTRCLGGHSRYLVDMRGVEPPAPDGVKIPRRHYPPCPSC